MYIGFDLSTQQLKIVVTDEKGVVIFTDSHSFDIPYTSSSDGLSAEQNIVVADPSVWLQAFDVLLMKMYSAGFSFADISAISGAAQQHGSVYWNSEADKLLGNLNPTETLEKQLKMAFASHQSPIWMDSSTSQYCHLLTEHMGGDQVVYQHCGSIMYERFTGPQIMKKNIQSLEEYTNTKSISLVSSFAASLFCGEVAPMDFSDGSGTGLMDVRKKQWIKELCHFIDGHSLISKLPLLCDGLHVIGCISQYMQQRYGFSEKCKIVAFTGDNPASVAALELTENDICISLGSSDTILARQRVLPVPDNMEALPMAQVDSTNSDEFYMLMYCFKNGSLTRDNVCRELCQGSWNTLEAMLAQTPKGNNGYVGFFYDLPEITPRNHCGRHFFDVDNVALEKLPSDAVCVRALLEGQVLSRRYYSDRLGVKLNSSSRLLLTGGASVNVHIAQIFADIFNCPTYVAEIPNSAAYGAALRAKLSTTGSGFDESLAKKCKLVAIPSDNSIYGDLLSRYAALKAKTVLH